MRTVELPLYLFEDEQLTHFIEKMQDVIANSEDGAKELIAPSIILAQELRQRSATVVVTPENTFKQIPVTEN